MGDSVRVALSVDSVVTWERSSLACAVVSEISRNCERIRELEGFSQTREDTESYLTRHPGIAEGEGNGDWAETGRDADTWSIVIAIIRVIE
ncbi:MAG: hypothetical protein N2691_03520 [Patescibacteria group bacterium]|nr:hypothetical protein [Patescibacteria group bacterium]